MDSVFQQQSTESVSIESNGFSVVSFLTRTIFGIFSIICIVGYFLYQGGRTFAQRFYLLPPTDYRDTLKNALINPTGLVASSKIGVKKASYRRRLIMASQSPISYSTLPLNSINSKTEKVVDNSHSTYYKLRVAPVDRLPENKDHFLMNIKPIETDNLQRKKLFGFFHPFSYTFGGGEKVLWEAVISTLENDISNIAIIYTFTPSTDTSAFSILKSVTENFGIDFLSSSRTNVRERIVFINLPNKYQWLITASSYKMLSMIGQAIGSVILVLLAFQQVTPDIFVDTIGVPFSYVFVYGLLDIPIISYIHYPTVSRDMLTAAKNIGGIYGFLKYCYWSILLKLYTFSILWVDIKLFNSTWTGENVAASLGWAGKHIDLDECILYPPCVSYDDIDFDKTPIDNLIRSPRDRCIVYLAQFRPEKRHKLLIRHYQDYLSKCASRNIDVPHKLVLVGSVRLNKDEEFIRELQDLINELNIPRDLILFELNASNETVNTWLNKSDFGINCMWKEHFGIAVVEYMLNGAIPLVHASAGPLQDIVIPRVNGEVMSRKQLENVTKINDSERSGLFFQDESDPDFNSKARIRSYPTLSEMLLTASTLTDVEKSVMRENAIVVARTKFGRSAFSTKWNEVVSEVVEIEKERRELRGKVERSY